MIEPNGPLPATVYWRRRAIAAGVSLAAVVVLAWTIGGLVEAADQQPVQGAGGSRGLATAPTTGRPGTGATSDTSPTATPTGQPTTTPGTSTSPSQPPSQPPSQSRTEPEPPPGPPQPCPDTVVKVDAEAGAPSYPVGQKPLLRLIVVNVGEQPCTRDVSRALRELVITSADGATRLWSSNDCYGPPGADNRTLAPNEPLTFSLNWAGRTSAPGCPLERSTVPAGTYRLIGKLGALTGAPAQLVLT